jgi:hypothetical protein
MSAREPASSRAPASSTRSPKTGAAAHLRIGASIVMTLVIAGSFAACVDPVHDAQITALGPEAAGVAPSEFHRAGQPCTVCHQASGPANTVFAVAGTIFYGPDKVIGAEGVQVELVDSAGTYFTATTNCVGNFYIPPDIWNPAFPLLVQVQYPGQGSGATKMLGQISREGSCAGCHKDPANYDSPGHVHAMTTEPANPFIDQNCPVNPELYTAGTTVPAGAKL